MKKINFVFLILFILTGLSSIHADLQVTATTTTNNGDYSPKNVFIMWIEDVNGTFIKSIHAECAIRTRYLYTWVSKSGWTTIDPWEGIDGWTGATRRNHGTVTATWDLTDSNGQPVPFGTYKFCAEYTEQHAQGPLASGTIVIGTQNTTANASSAYITMTATYTAAVIPPTPTPTATQTPIPTPQFVNIALHKPVVTSGDYSPVYPKNALTDGDHSTLWGSSPGMNQDWFYVDLGAIQEVNGIGLFWFGDFFSSRYSVYMSNDGQNWTSLATLNKSITGADVFKTGISFNCRYLAILSLQKKQVAIALNEFEVYQKQ